MTDEQIDEVVQKRFGNMNVKFKLHFRRAVRDCLSASIADTAGAKPVAWAVYNGVCIQAFFKSEETASRYAVEMQKNHDLSGSLAAFIVKPLYAAAHPAPSVADAKEYMRGYREGVEAGKACVSHVAPSVADAAGASDFTHELKTDIDVFAAVLDGRKTYEIRRNDRGFKVGDTLRLRETRYTGQEMRGPEPRPLEYTGREVSRVVSHILDGYGLQPGWVILSFAAGASEGQAVIDCGECACLPGICDKEEALKPAGYVIPQRLQSDDPVISLYRKPEGGARKPLYTHPSAELTALRERVAGIRLEALKEARHVVYMALSLNDAFKSIDALVDKEPKQ